MAYGSGYFGGYYDITDSCLLPQGLSLDGIIGNYASTPDFPLISLQGTESILELSGFTNTYADIPGNSADINIGADLELRWEGFVDNFISGAPADQQHLISNYNHNNAGFKLYMSTNLTSIRFQASIPGNNASMGASHSLAPNTRIRIRVVRTFTTGSTTIFAGPASTDWLSLPSLSTAVIFANTIIPNSAVTMKLGSGEGVPGFSGRTSNASMVVGGTTVFNPDFSTTPWVIGDVATQARLDTAGKTWTLRGNAGIVALAERRSLRLSGTTGVYTSTPDSAAVSLQGTLSALRLGNGNGFASTPDSVPLSITGDIDIRAKILPNVWTADGYFNGIISKDGNGPNQGWWFRINTNTKRLQYGWSVTGSDNYPVTSTSTADIPFADGVAGWVRVVHDVNNGAGGNDVLFYTSPDGITYNQLGTTITNAGTTSIFDTSTNLTVGSLHGGAHFFKGNIFAIEVRNGIAGTIVSNPDFSITPWVIGDQSATARSSGGATWTLNGNAEIVAAAERRSLRLSGASGMYVSTPDSVALSITGDIDLRWFGVLDDWTPGTSQVLISKTNTNQLSYQMFISTDGRLNFNVSGNGTAYNLVNNASTLPLGIADASPKWLRCTLATGTGGWILYTSDNGTIWTTVGSGTGTAGAIFDSTSILHIGANFGGGANNLTGNVYYAEVRNGIAGTIVANPDFSTRPWDVGESNGTTGGDAAGNVWTISGTGAVIQKAFTSDLDVRAYITPDTWTGNAGQGTGIIAKWTDAGQQFSFIFRLSLSAKTMNLLWSSNGSVITFPNATSTASVPFADSSAGWVRATLDMDNGSNQRVVIFYTSTDGQNWSQLGSTVTQSGTTLLLDSTTPLTIGIGNLAQPGLLAGNVSYAEVRNGIDGVVVSNPDFRKRPWVVGETATANHADRVGATWTLNGAGAVIQRAFASDLDIRVKVNITDLDNGGLKQGFISSKQGTNTGFGLGLNTSGALELAWGNGGISFFKGASLAGIMADGDTKWLRATLDVDDGAGNEVVRFYWSDNGALSWTLFSTATTAGPTLIADSPNTILMGANGTTFQTMKGVLYYVSVRNGIDGTQIIDFNPGAPPWQVGDTSPTARPDMFGNVFTLVGNAIIIGPTGDCESAVLCGGGYAGGQYASAVYAGVVPCSGPDYPSPDIESNVEEFCILPYSCT